MTENATLGGGCFWCIEAALQELDGVETVTSGYAGGDTEDPSYREVCGGQTGHAEVVRVTYDPESLSYEELLEVFFSIHDPTQRDRQGPDVGTQYRSIVLAESDAQERVAADMLEALDQVHDDEVETEITRLDTFYRAEEKHQNYFEKHPDDAYCQYHAQPKVEKVRERYATVAEGQ